jgi:hypothetical protein
VPREDEMPGTGCCGLRCSECEFNPQVCPGCNAVEGKTFWASNMPDGTCPLYACSVHTRGYSTCGECDELPCKEFEDLRDPSVTVAEHSKGVEERVHRLTARAR